MKNLTGSIKKLFFSKDTSHSVRNFPIDFIKNKKAMMRELVLSKERGHAIGVYAKGMGEGMFLTVVENIHVDGIIEFSQYDMSGIILSRYEFSLDEIQAIFPIKQRYRHPLMSKATLKSSIEPSLA